MASLIRFLIDECLSPELAEALSDETVQFTHVNHRGLSRASDPRIAQWCVDHDHALVTNNARDFRRIYARLPVHPGLVIILPSVRIPKTIHLMRLALPLIVERNDLVNVLVEIAEDGSVDVKNWPTS